MADKLAEMVLVSLRLATALGAHPRGAGLSDLAGVGTMKKLDGFGHESPYEGETNDWITPKWLIDAFGSNYFDLDPCASVHQPWPCARQSITPPQDGLTIEWDGNVWLNPPYGPYTSRWVRRLSEGGRTGIALIFARTETELWQDHIFPTADGFLFLRRRVAFHRPDGTLPKSSSGAPSAIIAWGTDNRNKLIDLCDAGVLSGAFCDRAFYTQTTRVKQASLLGTMR